MLIAAIDIGTNSTRLLIAEKQQGQITPIHTALEITRIGEGIGLDHRIKEPSLVRTLECLERYIKKCHEFQVEKVRIVATSAVRDAENKDEVAQKIYEKAGVHLEVLSGEKEAELSFLGAISDLGQIFTSKAMVLDIGGGSTELIYPSNKGIEYKSVNLGTVRLYENPKLLETMPQTLLELTSESSIENPFLIGVAGTVTTLVAIKFGLEEYDPTFVHGQQLSLEEIKSMGRKLSRLSLVERKKVKGLHPARADIIPYGIMILGKTMELLKVPQISVSERDILYGMIISAKNGEC